MQNHPIRIGRSLVLGLALGLSAVGGLAGCNAGDPEPAQSAVRNVLVTADTIASLAPGELLKLDLADQKVVYHLDYSKAAIDYSRIRLVLENGDILPLEDAMKAVELRDYDGNPAPDLNAAADKRFQVSADPENFQILDDVQISELETKGYYIKQSSSSPAAKPQNADDCIHAECVICEPSWAVDYDGPRVYVHIQHVWCGPP